MHASTSNCWHSSHQCIILHCFRCFEGLPPVSLWSRKSTLHHLHHAFWQIQVHSCLIQCLLYIRTLLPKDGWGIHMTNRVLLCWWQYLMVTNVNMLAMSDSSSSIVQISLYCSFKTKKFKLNQTEVTFTGFTLSVQSWSFYHWCYLTFSSPHQQNRSAVILWPCQLDVIYSKCSHTTTHNTLSILWH